MREAKQTQTKFAKYLEEKGFMKSYKVSRPSNPQICLKALK